MPRNITTAFKSWLNGTRMDVAICVLLVMPNGTTMGFTTWDENILYNGITYSAQNAVTGSAIDSNIGTGVDNMEVTGLLISGDITDADIAAGMYDNSRLKLFMINPSNTSSGILIAISGVLGDFKTQNSQYVVELRSLTQLLSQTVGDNVSPTCLAKRFGDPIRCRFNTITGVDTSGNPVRSVGTVTSVQDVNTLTFSGLVSDIGYYSSGTVAFTTGLNVGLSREIKVYGNPSSATTTNLFSSPATMNNIGFDHNTGAGWPSDSGTNFTFTIPPGNWSSGYITTIELWTLQTMQNEGSDGLYICLPDIDQYLITNESWTGLYEHSIQCSITTMNAINTIATAGGGTISGKLQHWNSNGTQYMNVNVNTLALTLYGTPVGTTNLVLLSIPFPFPIAIGDQAYVTGGCDFLPTTCHTKWNNINNFQGFPYVPGTDLILSVGNA